MTQTKADGELPSIEFSESLPKCYKDWPVYTVNQSTGESEKSLPEVNVTLNNGVSQQALLKIYGTSSDYFFHNCGIFWQNQFVIGCGSHIHFVGSDYVRCKTLSLGPSLSDYFMHFHTSDDFPGQILPTQLLVVTGTGLMLQEQDGRTLWRCDGLACDGVVVDSIEDGTIRGSAEMDPPDGWVPFKVSLKDGSVEQL